MIQALQAITKSAGATILLAGLFAGTYLLVKYWERKSKKEMQKQDKDIISLKDLDVTEIFYHLN